MTRFHTARIVSLAALTAAAGLPVAVVAAAPAAAATTYTITDLGSLGLGSAPNGINATGWVTGYSYLSTLVPTPSCVPYRNHKPVCTEHPYHAFVWSNGKMTDLGLNFFPSAINDNGVIIGGDQVYSGGTLQSLNNLIPANSGYQITSAVAINDKGQILAQDGGTALLLTPN